MDLTRSTSDKEAAVDLAALLAVEVSELSDEGARLHLLELHTATAMLEAATYEATAALDRRGLYAADGARSAAGWLVGRVDHTRGRCQRDVKLSDVVVDLPVVLAAARAGRLGRDKVALLAEVRTPELVEVFTQHEAYLVDQVAGLRVVEAGRFLRSWQQLARLHVGYIDPDEPVDTKAPRVRADLAPTFDDRWVLDAEMDGEHGRTLQSILGAEVDENLRVGIFGPDDGLTPGERRGHALFNLLTRKALAKHRHGARVASVEVICDEATLEGRPIDGDDDLRSRVCEYIDGEPVLPQTLQRYLCGARLHRLMISADGEVLDAGKDIRLANRGQRRALRFRHARHCGFPGCDSPIDWCEAHHIEEWDPDPDSPRGRTDMANLVPLCRFHHHRVHEGGFTLTMTPDGEVTVLRPPDRGGGARCRITPARPHRGSRGPHPEITRARQRVRALVDGGSPSIR